MPKIFKKHQKLKENPKKLKDFHEKTQGKTRKTQESANSSWDGLAKFGQKKACLKGYSLVLFEISQSLSGISWCHGDFRYI